MRRPSELLLLSVLMACEPALVSDPDPDHTSLAQTSPECAEAEASSCVSETRDWLRHLLVSYRDHGGRGGIAIPGVAAAAYDRRGGHWSAAFGVADLDTGQPMTTKTRLNGSSSAKQMSAILFLKLKSLGFSHNGRTISLDDRLVDYGCNNTLAGLAAGQCGWGIPQHNPNAAGNPITIRHLLGNVSGIPIHLQRRDDPTVAAHIYQHAFFGPTGNPQLPMPPGWSAPPHPSAPITAQHMVETYDLSWALDSTLTAPPSMWREPGIETAGFAYNNLNFTLVSLVIEELTGMSYPQALRHYLFEPHGLDFTQELLPSSSFAPGYSDGYVCWKYDEAWRAAYRGECLDFEDPACLCGQNHDRDVDLRGFDGSWAQGAGYLVSSVEGMARFLWLLHNGEILPKGPLAEPLTEYWELFSWTCDSTLGHDCGETFYRYGMAFYSRAVKDANGAVLYETYGHDGGGFLPRFNRVALDVSALPEVSVEAIYVQAANRYAAQTDWYGYYEQADASLHLIKEAGL